MHRCELQSLNNPRTLLEFEVYCWELRLHSAVLVAYPLAIFWGTLWAMTVCASSLPIRAMRTLGTSLPQLSTGIITGTRGPHSSHLRCVPFYILNYYCSWTIDDKALPHSFSSGECVDLKPKNIPCPRHWAELGQSHATNLRVFGFHLGETPINISSPLSGFPNASQKT